MPTGEIPKTVVFIVPALPSFRGNGLVMRAAATLKLLSSWCDRVHLLVVPLYPSLSQEPDPEIAGLVSSWQRIENPQPGVLDSGVAHWREALRGAVPSELKMCSAASQEKIKTAIASLEPDLVFVFRFYLAPFVLPAMQTATPFWLDVDELESTSRARLAQLYAGAKHPRESIARMEFPAYERLEREHLKSFARLFAASELECATIRARHGHSDVRVMPNVYPFVLPQEQREPNGRARLLFVGTFNYFPNQDAIEFFSKQVLPTITARSARPVETIVIGSGFHATGGSLSSGITIVGAVPDTTPYYADCDAVIVPLRAGGGTRIKILEAFSHRRAVVSTSVGAEGLRVEDRIHLRIADDPESIAQRCLELLDNGHERTAMAQRAHTFFLEQHSLTKLEAAVDDLFGA
jgi:polysaccharide biosynthesis protein PslH